MRRYILDTGLGTVFAIAVGSMTIPTAHAIDWSAGLERTGHVVPVATARQRLRVTRVTALTFKREVLNHQQRLRTERRQRRAAKPKS